MDCLCCQASKLAEWDFEAGGVFLFNVQPRAPRDGYTTIIQRDFYDSMSGSILAGGVVMQSAYGCHLLGPLESLRIVDDEKQIPVIFLKQTKQHIQGNLLHYDGTVPDAAPEKFTMVGSMSRVPQCLGQSVNGYCMSDGDSHCQGPKVLPCSLVKMVSEGLEKTLQFFGDIADCNHMASLVISDCIYNSYRQSRPFFFWVLCNHKFKNRSV